MTTDQFAFEKERGSALTDASASRENCVGACPLAKIPGDVWRHLFRRPFRKRHPLIFWTVAVVTALAAGLLFSFNDNGGELLNDGERIALVTVRGPIMDVSEALQWIHDIERRLNVKGVLVRVDSPGGGAAASQELYSALAGLAESRPVAVSMGAVAASGGLMISMAGNRVFASPSTVTGSIGVRMDIPQLQGLFDKIGIGQQTLVTAPYKNAGSYLRELTSEEKSYFEGVLADMHTQFTDIVAQGRHMPREQVAQLANGKIFTGREAKQIGLVDELGGQDSAHRWLALQTGVPFERNLLTCKKKTFWLNDKLKAWFGLDIDGAAAGDWRTPVFLYQF
ncbi:MAG: signal peptide peptidase SppA [Desulfovibrio sp.]|nr:signal peptide peptidase SppA [Desulfovibrio sp.]